MLLEEPIYLLAAFLIGTLVSGLFFLILYSRRHKTIELKHQATLQEQETLRSELTAHAMEITRITQQYEHLSNSYRLQVNSSEKLEQNNAKLLEAKHQVDTENRLLHERALRQQDDISDYKANSEKLQQRLEALNEEKQSLEININQLKVQQEEKQSSFEAQKLQFNESRKQLKTEFENLANKIVEEKGNYLNRHSQASLNAVLDPFKQQIESFQKRVNQVHDESLKGNAHIESELKKVLEIGLRMSEDAGNLTAALKGDKKKLGDWGEAQLEKSLQLAGLVKDHHYSTQESFKDKNGNHYRPDFVIKLPDNKHLVVDSKVSLVAYESAVAADSEGARKIALERHIKDVRNHIDDLAKKDYSHLIGVNSPGFVLMFLPVEPAYIEALRQSPELFNYGYNKNVVLVSHTTLMPILRTVANLWRVDQGTKEALAISEKAGDIYNSVCLVSERLGKLGGSLQSATNHFNDTVTGLAGNQGLYGKVERFKQVSNKAIRQMPELSPLNLEIDQQRLENNLKNNEAATKSKTSSETN